MQVGERSKLFPDGDNFLGEEEDWNHPLPLATWYDDAMQNFVTLLDRRPEAPPPTVSEWVEYQSLTRSSSHTSSSSTSLGEKIQLGTLWKFRLPATLSIFDSRQKQQEQSQLQGARCPPRNNENVAPLQCTRRCPTYAKLSLDEELLALQFSPHLLRIIPLISDDSKNKAISSHWTIDLAVHGGEPLSSPPDTFPITRNKKESSASNNKLGDILPGGIIWSDHGGNSQDLVIVTTKALLCYKISLVRNQMAATHTFHHPLATAVWWEPQTRAIVIGSYGPASECHNTSTKDSKQNKNDSITILQLKTFFLRFTNARKSKHALPRLELPPPKHLPPFGVGLDEFNMNENTTTSTEPGVKVGDVRLVNLYGNPYVVVFSVNSKHLQISLYRLEPSMGGMFMRYIIEELTLTTKDMKSILATVLDNILCVSLRHSRRSVFVDIEDRERSYFLDELDDSLCDLGQSEKLSYMTPCYIFNHDDRGNVFVPVALDIEKLAKTLPLAPSLPPFFLRRRASAESHAMAMAKFEALLKLQNSRKRNQTIDEVVRHYAKEDSAKLWDWRASVSLIYESALFPKGAELRTHGSDGAMTFYRLKEDISPPSCSQVLHQVEILLHILLPFGHQCIRESNDDSSAYQLLDIGLSFISALDRHERPPCPALECFVFSLMWRIGCDQELGLFLRSRCYDRVSKNCGSNIPSGLLDMATAVLVNAMVAIIEEVPFGKRENAGCCSSKETPAQGRNLRRKVQSDITRLLVTRVCDPTVAISHLLCREKIFDAMDICSTHLYSNIENTTSDYKKTKRLRWRLDAALYVSTAMRVAKTRYVNYYDRCRLLDCFASFLSRWDPSFALQKQLQNCAEASDVTTSMDEIDLREESRSCYNLLICRRPSMSSFNIICKRQEKGTQSVF